jgi:DNA processing protein
MELVAGARPITRAADVIDVLGGPAPPPRGRARRSPRGAPPACATLPLPPPPPACVTPPLPAPRPAAPASAPPAPPGGGAPARDLGVGGERSAEERAVLDALGARPSHVDEVCEKTGLPPRRAVEALLTLTLQAVVVEGPAGLFRRALR